MIAVSDFPEKNRFIFIYVSITFIGFVTKTKTNRLKKFIVFSTVTNTYTKGGKNIKKHYRNKKTRGLLTAGNAFRKGRTRKNQKTNRDVFGNSVPKENGKVPPYTGKGEGGSDIEK